MGAPFMNIWILYRHAEAHLKPEAYEMRRLLDVGRSRGHDIQVRRPEDFELLVTSNSEPSIMINHDIVPLPDVMLPRMGAGTNYFALSVIRQLERLQVPTFNSSRSIETVRDKLFTHQLLARHKLPLPKTMLAKFPVELNIVQEALGFPVVVKTLSGSQGSGVYLCETRQHFDDLMQLIQSTQSNTNLIFQEFIANSRGRDVRMFVIGGRVVAAMERRSTHDSFKANYSQGAEVIRFEPNRDAEWLALQSARLLGLDIAGIDLLFDQDGFKVCEANSSPGFEGLESCCDINIAEEILDFVQFRL